jgi:hypothetical protein
MARGETIVIRGGSMVRGRERASGTCHDKVVACVFRLLPLPLSRGVVQGEAADYELAPIQQPQYAGRHSVQGSRGSYGRSVWCGGYCTSTSTYMWRRTLGAR